MGQNHVSPSSVFWVFTCSFHVGHCIRVKGAIHSSSVTETLFLTLGLAIVTTSLFLLHLSQRRAHWLLFCLFCYLPSLWLGFSGHISGAVRLKTENQDTSVFTSVTHLVYLNLGLVVEAIRHLIHSVSHYLSDLELLEVVGKKI